MAPKYMNGDAGLLELFSAYEALDSALGHLLERDDQDGGREKLSGPMSDLVEGLRDSVQGAAELLSETVNAVPVATTKEG